MSFLKYNLLVGVLVFTAWGGSARAAAEAKGTIPDDIQRASLRTMEDLRHQKIDAVEQEATEASRHQEQPLSTILSKMATAFPPGEPKLIRAVGYTPMAGAAGEISYYASYEYEFPKRWVLVRLEWQRADNKLRLNGVNIRLLDASIEDTNAFTLAGKGIANYVILGLAVLAPVFSLYTLFLCLKTKGIRWKWLWALFIIIGFGSLTVEWTTGSSSLTILSVKLLSVSWMRRGLGPWLISVGLPLGALLFYWRLARFKKARTQLNPAPSRA